MPIGIYEVMLFLHLVFFVYWLGPDWGVYVLSPRVWDSSVSVAERRRWAATLVRLSQISRNSLILLIPVGVTLAWELGVSSLDASHVLVLWIASLAWVAVSVGMYHLKGTETGQTLTTIDQTLRYILIPLLLLLGGMSILQGVPFDQHWVGAKLMIFAFLLVNSIQQRNIALKWMAALADIETATSDDEREKGEAVFKKTGPRSKFNAYLTWTGTLIIAFLGTTKIF